MKPPKRATNLFFGALLAICLAVIATSGIAWALGWVFGPYAMLIAGAFASVPMFHFAMHWPFRDRD